VRVFSYLAERGIWVRTQIARLARFGAYQSDLDLSAKPRQKAAGSNRAQRARCEATRSEAQGKRRSRAVNPPSPPHTNKPALSGFFRVWRKGDRRRICWKIHFFESTSIECKRLCSFCLTSPPWTRLLPEFLYAWSK